MLVQLQFGVGVVRRRSGSGSCFLLCPKKKEKKKKSFIAITRDLLKEVLDANYLTNCRRVRNVQMCCSSQ